MTVTFNEDIYNQLSAIIDVVRMQGQMVFASAAQDNECWVSFCGLKICFVKGLARILQSSDMHITLTESQTANDNGLCEGYKCMALNFIHGDIDNLALWHRDLIGFSSAAAHA